MKLPRKPTSNTRLSNTCNVDSIRRIEEISYDATGCGPTVSELQKRSSSYRIPTGFFKRVLITQVDRKRKARLYSDLAERLSAKGGRRPFYVWYCGRCGFEPMMLSTNEYCVNVNKNACAG